MGIQGFFTKDGKHRPIFGKKQSTNLPPASTKPTIPKNSSLYLEHLANTGKRVTTFARDKARQRTEDRKMKELEDLKKIVQDEKNITKSLEEIEQSQRMKIEDRKKLDSHYDMFHGGGMFIGNVEGGQPIKEERQTVEKQTPQEEMDSAIRFKLLETPSGRARLGFN